MDGGRALEAARVCTFPLAQAQEALQQMADRRAIGRIALLAR